MVYEKFAAGLEEGLEKFAFKFSLKSVLDPIYRLFGRVSSPPLRYPRYESKYYNPPRAWLTPLSPELKRRAELNVKRVEDYFNKK